MWRYKARGAVYVYDQDRQNPCGELLFFSDKASVFKTNQKHRITQYVRVDDPNQANGVVITWLDGKKVAESASLRLRGKVADEVARVDQLKYVAFHGGCGKKNWPTRKTKLTST